MWTFSAGVGVEVEVFLFPVAAMCRLPSGKSGQMRPEHLVATDVPAPCHFKMRNKLTASPVFQNAAGAQKS